MRKNHWFIVIFLVVVSTLVYTPLWAGDTKKVTLPEGLQPITLGNAAQISEVLTLDPHTLDLVKFAVDGDMVDNTDWLRAIASADASGGLEGVGISADYSLAAIPLIENVMVIIKMVPPRGSQKTDYFGTEYDDTTSASLSPDNLTLAVGDDTGLVGLWDVKKNAEIAHWQAQSGYTIVAFTPDGSLLATGGELSGKGVVQLWNPETQELTATFDNPDGALSLDFSADGSLLAIGGTENITLWDVAAGKSIATLDGHTEDYVPSVAFNPDGSILASGSSDGTIYLWDVASGDPAATLTGTVNDTDYLRTVVFLDFSPDGAILISTERDSLLQFWGTTTAGA